MALRLALLKSTSEGKGGCILGLRRWAHAMAQPAPLDTSISHSTIGASPPLVVPEHEDNNNSNIGFEFPYPPFVGGSMDLMAVPKKKISRHKRGIRNGPKALKPVPVIIRCKVCGRVKLPHFFCCSGIREENSGQS